jgi:hypothetical protein
LRRTAFFPDSKQELPQKKTQKSQKRNFVQRAVSQVFPFAFFAFFRGQSSSVP